MCHQSMEVLKKVAYSELSFGGKFSACDVCALKKRKQVSHPKTTDCDATIPFKLTVCNLMGPFPIAAIRDCTYVSKVAEFYSRWTAVCLFKDKSYALATVQLFVEALVMLLGLRVQCLRSDKGGEYAGRASNDHCLSMRICHEYAATNTPQQTDVSEHVGGALVAMDFSFLREGALPTFLWGELFVAAGYVSK